MEDLARIADWLGQADSVVAVTGAGISTESGIPDFRSPNGVWATNRQIYFDEFLARSEARYEYWRQKAIAHDQFLRSRPNPGHRVLARWETEGRLRGVVTQNIDGLHQDAGCRHVIELHGTARQVSCLDCGRRFEADPWVRKFLQDDAVPACPDCGGLLKHATISFGQALSEEALNEAVAWCCDCDLCLAIGSSLVVHPAASLPRLAAQRGARLVIINRTETPLDDLASAVVRAGIGETLQAIDEHVNEARRR